MRKEPAGTAADIPPVGVQMRPKAHNISWIPLQMTSGRDLNTREEGVHTDARVWTRDMISPFKSATSGVGLQSQKDWCPFTWDLVFSSTMLPRGCSCWSQRVIAKHSSQTNRIAQCHHQELQMRVSLLLLNILLPFSWLFSNLCFLKS